MSREMVQSLTMKRNFAESKIESIKKQSQMQRSGGRLLGYHHLRTILTAMRRLV